MTKKALKLFFFLLCNAAPWTVYALLLIASYGILEGIATTLLCWSFYILCLPGAHGRHVLGYPLSLLGYHRVRTEPIVWSGALIGNLLAISFAPHLYFRSIMTRLLYHTLATPYPCWSVILVAACGTFYQAHTRYSAHTKTSNLSRIISQLILLASIMLCLYLLLEPFIILLNAIM